MPTSGNKHRHLPAVMAVFAGAAVPIMLVVLSFAYAQYAKGVPKGPAVIPLAHEFAKIYIPVIYLPILILLTYVTVYFKRRDPSLFRRVVSGWRQVPPPLWRWTPFARWG